MGHIRPPLARGAPLDLNLEGIKFPFPSLIPAGRGGWAGGKELRGFPGKIWEKFDLWFGFFFKFYLLFLKKICFIWVFFILICLWAELFKGIVRIALFFPPKFPSFPDPPVFMALPTPFPTGITRIPPWAVDFPEFPHLFSFFLPKKKDFLWKELLQPRKTQRERRENPINLALEATPRD